MMLKKIEQIFFLLLLSALLLFACGKENVLDTNTVTAYHIVSASWYYYGGSANDAFVVELQLEQDGAVVEIQQVGETLTPEGSVSDRTLVFHASEVGKETRLVLKNVTTPDSTRVLDTVVQLRENASFQFLQMTTTDLPTLYTGHDTSDEPDPDTISLAKYQYYYSDTTLPDSIKLVFYSYNETHSPYTMDKLDEPARDSLIAYKGKFSDYVTLDCISTDYVYFFQVKNAQDGSIIQEIKFLSPSLALGTATGYATAISDNVRYNTTLASYQTKYKFITALIYKKGSKYLDKTLFTTEW